MYEVTKVVAWWGGEGLVKRPECETPENLFFGVD